jgi:hypothetical protein
LLTLCALCDVLNESHYELVVGVGPLSSTEPTVPFDLTRS